MPGGTQPCSQTVNGNLLQITLMSLSIYCVPRCRFYWPLLLTTSCSQGNRATVAQPLMPSVLEHEFMLRRQGFIRDPPADKDVAFAKSVSTAASAVCAQCQNGVRGRESGVINVAAERGACVRVEGEYLSSQCTDTLCTAMSAQHRILTLCLSMQHAEFMPFLHEAVKPPELHMSSYRSS